MDARKRRTRIAARGAVSAIVLGMLLAPSAVGQSLDQPWEKLEPTTVYFSHAVRGWTGTPSVVVAGRPDDPRAALVGQAVAFWNTTLEQIGSGFRLGTITYTSATVPDD